MLKQHKIANFGPNFGPHSDYSLPLRGNTIDDMSSFFYLTSLQHLCLLEVSDMPVKRFKY